MKKAVFLDRDGVLNHSIIKDGKPYAPRHMAEFVINPEISALSRLKELGYLLIIITNQPDVANGLATHEFVAQAHSRLCAEFPFDDIMVCFHSDKDNCNCRKPKPAMLYQARDKFDINLADSFMIGDRWRDILAATAASCKSIFIDYKYTEHTPDFTADFTCSSLLSAIDYICSRAEECAKNIK